MRRTSRTTRIVLMLLLAVLAAMVGIRRAEAQMRSEYHVKAAFLVNFAQYIEWPASAFANEESPIVVGVLGENPFDGILEATLAETSAQGRRFALKRGRHPGDMRDCHLLFVCRGERDRQSEIIASLKDVSVVTVGDQIPEFASRGGIINFYLLENKIRFEINLSAAERKRLKISSQLLRRGRRVD